MPYIQRIRRQLGVSDRETALVIFDMHRTNIKNAEFYTILSRNNILWSVVPASMTDELQPMDQLVNRKIKEGLRKEFDTYYTGLVSNWIGSGNRMEDFVFDDRLSTLKNIYCTWITTVFNGLQSADISQSFTMCGISSSLDDNDGDDDESNSDDGSDGDEDA